MARFAFQGTYSHETHLPAFGRAPQTHSRVSRAYAYQGRSCGDSCPPRQRSSAFGGLSLPPRADGSDARRGFQQEHRLRASDEFGVVLASGRVLRGNWFNLYYYKGAASSGARLGIIIGKKFAARAVQRNLLKRLAREAFRKARPMLGNYDLVVRLTRAAGRKIDKQARVEWRTELEGLFARLPNETVVY